MDVLDIEIGKPEREHEIERTPMTVPQPLTVPKPREVELPDPGVIPETVPEKVPA